MDLLFSALAAFVCSLARGTRELACAVTALESGDTGRMEGKMGIGAPFAHVDRLVAAGLGFGLTTSGVVLCEMGAGREGCCSDSTGAGLSLPISDLLNHEGLVVRFGGSLGSLDESDLKLLSDCFRPSNLEDDFGRSGSAASAKYS